MNGKTVKYIGYYDRSIDGEYNHKVSPAGTAKMDYVASLLARNGFVVEIISLARRKSVSIGKKKSISVDKNLRLKYIFSVGGDSKLAKVIDLIIQRTLIFLYLLLFTSSKDIVVVYHSLGYGGLIGLARNLRGFRLILEVEEVYQDVAKISNRLAKLEIKNLMIADGYIFPTDLLNKRLNDKGKPFLIIHGVYSVEYKTCVKFDDGKIHLIYAGTFDPKKGVLSVISSMKFLDPGYHLHVLGFGRNEEILDVKKSIDQLIGVGGGTVTYEGLLVGDDYSRFLSRCHIGLACSADLSAEFNNSSFPSKILSYLSHDLRVITVDIKAVRESSVAKHVHFVNSNEPELLAMAIRDVSKKAHGASGSAVLARLDEQALQATRRFFVSLERISHA